MRILTDEDQYAGRGCALALGMFDGMHIGHRKLIETAVTLARSLGVDAVVDTFSEHPLRLLCPQRAPRQLCTNRQRAARMEALGVDVLVMRPFTRDYAAQPPEQFVRWLCARLRPRHIVVGYNYTFGCGGSGDASLLARLSAEIDYRLTVIEPVTWAGEPVSSTRIRRLLAEGRAAAARAMMDWPEGGPEPGGDVPVTGG